MGPSVTGTFVGDAAPSLSVTACPTGQRHASTPCKKYSGSGGRDRASEVPVQAGPRMDAALTGVRWAADPPHSSGTIFSAECSPQLRAGYGQNTVCSVQVQCFDSKWVKHQQIIPYTEGSCGHRCIGTSVEATVGKHEEVGVSDHLISWKFCDQWSVSSAAPRLFKLSLPRP